MIEPTQEQIREFWEWCGFTHLPFAPQFHTRPEDGLDPVFVYNPEGKYIGDYPPVDLNNLFWRAVPAAIELKGKHTVYLVLSRCLSKHLFAGHVLEDEIFWALWQVKGEK